MDETAERMAQGANIWDKLNDAEWQQLSRQVDWMAAPGMYAHVAALMGGKAWLDYARETHLLPLLKALQAKDPNKRGLKLLSIGCGTGEIDRHFFRSEWPLSEIHCLEYSRDLVEAARANLADVDVEKSFETFDMNAPRDLGRGKFDVVWFCHSIHHCTNVEALLPYINSIVHDDSLIMGCDYFGPNRLQVDPDNRKILSDLFDLLPEHLRLNISTRTVESKFDVKSAKDVAAYDPSEAPRSSDIRSLLFTEFPVVDIKPMGGTLLRHLITHRAGNFRSETDVALLGVIQYMERLLIREKVIDSDDLFFVVKRSERV